jgi:hypothetical protein
MKYSYEAGGQTFKSSKGDITHCVMFATGLIDRKCSSLELAEKAKAKDENAWGLNGLTIVEAVKI